MRHITILTGPAAAGKNTIANLYATRFCERCAVIDVDALRGMLRHPHAAPWEGTEGLAQHRLGVKHACLLAKSFADEGCEVIVLDVVWANLGQRYRQEFNGYLCRIVRLMPTWEESLKRLHERPQTISDEEARWVYDTQTALQDFDFSLDNTYMAAEEVAAWLASLPNSGESSDTK
jgi:chloramphenicol 3-O-phosphotransferase